MTDIQSAISNLPDKGTMKSFMSLVAANPEKAISILPDSSVKTSLNTAYTRMNTDKPSLPQLALDSTQSNPLTDYHTMLERMLQNRSDTPYDLQLESLVAGMGDADNTSNIDNVTNYITGNIDYKIEKILLNISIANALIEHATDNKVNELTSVKNNQKYTIETLMLWQKYVAAKLAEQEQLQRKLQRSVETRRRENVFNLTDKASIKTWRRAVNIAFAATLLIIVLYFCVQHYQTLIATAVRLRDQLSAMKKNIAQQQ